MNERFRKLMEEASFGACYDESTPVLYGHEPINEIELFAKLIVKDCLSIARLQRNNMQFLASNPPQSAAAYDIERNIMNHFGVEE